MGNDQSARIAKPIQKFDIEITCEKISRHLQLQRDRKINELALKERELAEKVKNKKRSYEDTLIDIGTLVNLMKYITASKIIIRYSQLIKEHSMLVAEACKTNNFVSIRELSPYFEGIVWSTNKLNLSYISEFNALIANHFRPTDVQQIMKMEKVDKELKDCFDSIEPSPMQIQKYLGEFLKRHKIEDFKGPNGQPYNYQPSGPGQGQIPNQGQGGVPYQQPQYGYNNQYPQGPGQMNFNPQQPYPNQGMGFPPGINPYQMNPNPYPPTNQFVPPQNQLVGIIDPNVFLNNQQGQNQPGMIPPSHEEDEIDSILKGLNLDNYPAPTPGINTGGNQMNISLPGPPPAFIVPAPNIPPQNFNQPANPTFAQPPINNTFVPTPQFQGPPPKVRNFDNGPEAYTDDKDDNCELGNFEPVILSARINQMRDAKV